MRKMLGAWFACKSWLAAVVVLHDNSMSTTTTQKDTFSFAFGLLRFSVDCTHRIQNSMRFLCHVLSVSPSLSVRRCVLIFYSQKFLRFLLVLLSSCVVFFCLFCRRHIDSRQCGSDVCVSFRYSENVRQSFLTQINDVQFYLFLFLLNVNALAAAHVCHGSFSFVPNGVWRQACFHCCCCCDALAMSTKQNLFSFTATQKSVSHSVAAQTLTIIHSLLKASFLKLTTSWHNTKHWTTSTTTKIVRAMEKESCQVKNAKWEVKFAFWWGNYKLNMNIKQNLNMSCIMYFV